jgi:hypothetical protein
MKMKLLIAAAVLLSTNALAQTDPVDPPTPQTFAIVAQSCNVALTSCVMFDENGAEYDLVGGPWVYSGNVTVNGVACTAKTTGISSNLYRVYRSLEITCDDGTVLDGSANSARSGSGRGGWAWHTHVSFDSVTF